MVSVEKKLSPQEEIVVRGSLRFVKLMIMAQIMKHAPRIHGNGTPPQKLITSLDNAYEALLVAQNALAECGVNPRDYEPESYEIAVAIQKCWSERLDQTKSEIDCIIRAIEKQRVRGTKSDVTDAG